MDCYFWGVLFRVALLSLGVLLMGASSGCCLLDGTCVEGGDVTDGGPPPEVASLDTPGCPSASIREEEGVFCADCSFADPSGAEATSSICGEAIEAPCEVRENANGDACQLCVTEDDSHTILFDDCFSGGNNAERVSQCETSPGDDAGEACTQCFDDNGDTVSIECGPAFDDCAPRIDEAGRTCTVCSRGDEVVSERCEAGDLDPAICLWYGDEDGSCVDCIDKDGVLLSHACTPAGGATTISCEQTFTPEGLSCTVCVDENGTPFERVCEEPEPTRCEQLLFTEQTCVVCLDVSNTVVSVDCVRNDCFADPGNAACRADADCAAGQVCFDGACVQSQSGGNDGEADPAPPAAPPCEPPPSCESSINDAGDLCRTCPLSDGTTETLCIDAPALNCTVVDEGTLPPDPNNGDDAGLVAPQERSCVVCTDARNGLEVYRDCEGNGSVPPPYCVDEVRGDGSACSVCYDAVNDAAVYTSCPDETCFDLESTTLLDLQGAPLTVPNTTDEALVDCKQCGTAKNTSSTEEAAAAFSSSCALASVCADPYGSNFDGVGCPATATITLAPRACDNAWEPWRIGAGDVGTLHAILAQSLEARFTVVGARVVTDATISECPSLVDGQVTCDCDSGQRIELAVVEADVEGVSSLYADVLAAP